MSWWNEFLGALFGQNMPPEPINGNLPTRQPLPDKPSKNLPIVQEGIDLIKEFEGFREDSYQDTVGVWTVGYGFTGEDIGPETTMSREQSEQILLDKLSFLSKAIKGMAPHTNAYQLAALASFSYNLGLGALRASTLLKKHNVGNYTGAADEFLLWRNERINGTLRPSAGLTRRREAERALYLRNANLQSA